MDATSLDAAAEELYAAAPEEFVDRRKQLVAAARKDKDRALAQQIGGLRKPTRTAWLVNLLARAERERVAELLDLRPAFEEAQLRRAGAELRRLSAERRALVDRLAVRAVDLGREHGYAAPDSAPTEIAQLLQAAVGDAETADLLRRGALAGVPQPAGFGGSEDLLAALAASMPGAAPPSVVPAPEPESGEPEPEPEPEPKPKPGPEREDPEQAAARAAYEQAHAAYGQAQAAAEQAESEADDATARADETADLVERLREQLEQAEAAEVVARSAARTARKRSAEARRAAEEARAEVEGAIAHPDRR